MNDLSSVDPMVALAELMLDADDLRAQSDEDELKSARREQQLALREEWRALHEAADHVRTGAWVEGCAAVASGALAGIAHAKAPLGKEPTGSLASLLACSSALGHMASPLGSELGEAPSVDAQADAKQAEQEAADAATRAELAHQHHERVLDDQDRMLATLQSTLESESQGNLAIISNV